MSPSRRLDDRIRDLCARIGIASDDEQKLLLPQLKSAIREKIERIRKLAATKLVGGSNHKERRNSENGVDSHPGA